MMRRRTTKWLIATLCLLLIGGTVAAREIFTSTDCTIPDDTTINGTVYVTCENLTILGQVNGDVIGGAVRTHVEGTIDGNLYLIGGQLDIMGDVTGDIHFGGAVLRINPDMRPDDDSLPLTQPQLTLDVRGSIKAMTLSLTIFEDATISDGLIHLGYQLIIAGDVNSEVNYWGSLLRIDGQVAGDIFASVGDPASESSNLETLLLPLNLDLELSNPGLLMGETAHVAGSLQYRGPEAGLIRGTVRDDIVYYPLLANTLPTLEEPGSLTVYFSQFGREFITLFLIGAFGLFIFPNLLQQPLNNLRTRPFASFSVGMLAFILSFPIVLIGLVLSLSILFALQIIGLRPLVVAVGIILGLINIGGVSIFYFMAIFVARALVSLVVGRVILRLTLRQQGAERNDYLALAVGLFGLSAVVSLPVVGWLFNAGALFLGLGTILNVLLAQFRRIRDTSPTPTPNWYTPSPMIQRQHVVTPRTPRIDVLPVEDDEQDENKAPTQPSRDIPQQLPSPDAPQRVQPGMANLPEGFDMSFFDDDDSSSE